MVTIGTVASRESGVVVVVAGGGWVALRSSVLLPLSPALARSLAELLVTGAEAAERCVCVQLVSGERLRNVACIAHRGGK